ncbi:hypothetical protein [Streptomyces sp. NBC_01716]|uniref:hypothetical protein n=1 Tax=Streptomyces sp. NBC_01716 TaxID=2975917 RepID=UPI002E33D8E9|nr:hypothetical protein [Streptomyces sp. NBC_01716]
MDTEGFVRMVGRRAALRYALAGVAASAVAACSGNGSTSVRSQTLGAFLKGSWQFEAENGKGARIDVSEDGPLLVTGGGTETPWSEEGSWSFEGGRLSVTFDRRAPYVVHDVPERVEKTIEGRHTLSGGLIDGQDAGYSKMQVSGGKDKLVLTFPEYTDDEPRVVTCVRVETHEAP